MKVILKRKKDNFTQEFNFSHAERILNLKCSAWELPRGSEFENRNGKLSFKKKAQAKKEDDKKD